MITFLSKQNSIITENITQQDRTTRQHTDNIHIQAYTINQTFMTTVLIEISNDLVLFKLVLHLTLHILIFHSDVIFFQI